jgi:hypothetical protein
VRLTDSAGSTFEDTVDDGVVLFMSDEPVAMPMRVKMAQTRAFHMPLHHLHLVPEHQELDCPSHPAGDSGSEQRATRKYTSESSTELLPVEESACYWWRLVPDLGF